MTYQEHINRVLARHHARVELGLAHARNIEPFVLRVANILSVHRVKYIFNLNDDFEPIFTVQEFSGCLKTLFKYLSVEQDGTCYVVSNPMMPEIQVVVKLEEVS